MHQRALAEIARGPSAAFVKLSLAIAAAVVVAGVAAGAWRLTADTSTGALVDVLLIGAASAVAVLLALIVLLLNRLRSQMNDVQALTAFQWGLTRTRWDVRDLFTEGAAGAPTLQLFHLKVLTLAAPATILELGSGQTTKLVSAYVQQSGAHAVTLEQNAGWAERVRAEVVHDYRHAPLTRQHVEIDGTTHTLPAYDLSGLVPAGGFEYVLVDGPDHGTGGAAHVPFSRGGVLADLPGLLAPSFVLVFDDAERSGERETVEACAAVLQRAGRRFHRRTLHGIKQQEVFVSPDRAWLLSV